MSEDRLWKSNTTIMFDNIIYDCTTGDKIFDFTMTSMALESPSNDTDKLVEVEPEKPSLHANLFKRDSAAFLFEEIVEPRHSRIFTRIPFHMQHLGAASHSLVAKKKQTPQLSQPTTANNNATPATTTTTTSQQQPQVPPLALHKSYSLNDAAFIQQQQALAQQQQLGSSPTQGNGIMDTSTSVFSAHAFPIASADKTELQFEHTNDSFLVLHDKRCLFVLFGNVLACFDMLPRKIKWKSKLYENKTPKVLYVNFFVQNSKHVYVVLPQVCHFLFFTFFRRCFASKKTMASNWSLFPPK